MNLTKQQIFAVLEEVCKSRADGKFETSLDNALIEQLAYRILDLENPIALFGQRKKVERRDRMEVDN